MDFLSPGVSDAIATKTEIKQKKRIRNPRTITLYLRNVLSFFSHSLNVLRFVEVWEQQIQAVIGETALTQIQFCQSFRIFQNQLQTSTDLQIQLSLTEIQLFTQSSRKRLGFLRPHMSQKLKQQRFITAEQQRARDALYTLNAFILDLCVNEICCCFSPELNRM